MTKIFRGLLLTAAASIMLTGCTKDGSPPVSQPTAVLTTTAPAATTPAPTTAPAATEDPNALPEGRSPVYISKVDAAAKTLTFDLLLFLTGEEAKAEWIKQGMDDETGDPVPPNDYMIVNNNPKLRTLPVSASATVIYNDQNNSFTPTPTTLAKLKGPYTYRPFWLTVKAGVITKIEEQFIP